MQFIDKYFWLFSMFLLPALYILTATAFYIILYTWKRNLVARHKIQPQYQDMAQLKRELFYGGISLVIFAVTGWIVYQLYRNDKSSLYLDWRSYGAFYFVVSIPLMVLFHDCYFYWTHRLLHMPGLYDNVHRLHHLSHNASPFTSLSFHPVEAVIQAAVLPLMVMVIPIHPYALFTFLIYMVYKNVRGHAGFEFTTPAQRNKKWNRIHSYAVHHNMHHAEGGGNYGLYFTVWDRLMKTFKKA